MIPALLFSVVLAAETGDGSPAANGPAAPGPAAPGPAAPGPVAGWTFLVHAGVGGYSLKLSDSGGSAASRALVVGGGGVVARELSSLFSLGALADLALFLPDSAGSPSTPGLLLGPAAVFKLGMVTLSAGPALSLLGQGNGAGLGLLGAADVAVAGPLTLHGQLSFRTAYPAGGSVHVASFELGLGLLH